jgi:hypothetical protein
MTSWAAALTALSTISSAKAATLSKAAYACPALESCSQTFVLERYTPDTFLLTSSLGFIEQR